MLCPLVCFCDGGLALPHSLFWSSQASDLSRLSAGVPGEYHDTDDHQQIEERKPFVQ